MHSRPQTHGVHIKTAAEIEAMRIAGQQAASVLRMIAEHVQPGVTTGRLDDICHAYIVDELDAVPAPLHYRGFPRSICTSVNHVVCHGIPGERELKDGDIVNIDITVIQDGWHGDTSKMFYVGEPSIKARRVCEVAHAAMIKGIETVRPGATLGDVGHAIQSFVEAQRCSVVREYCGHGIGRGFHEPPQVLHYGSRGQGLTLQPGMTFTIEPMVNLGKPGTRLLADGWTVLTKDRSLSAQWEHTMAVTDEGVDVLTRLPDDEL
jgi:methionyl aminopeptidase